MTLSAKLLNTPVRQANLGQFARVFADAAKENKVIAECLVAEGLRGPITPSSLRKIIGEDMFTKTGKQTKKALNTLKNKPKGITLRQMLKEIIADAKKALSTK